MKKPAHFAKSIIKPPLRLPSGLIIDRARNEICRLSLVSFIEAVHNLLNPGRPFLINWSILAVAYHLEQVRLGRIKRLIINLPPRFLKSLISSIASRVRPWSRSDQTPPRYLIWFGSFR
jgi:hypothetical protein